MRSFSFFCLFFLPLPCERSLLGAWRCIVACALALSRCLLLALAQRSANTFVCSRLSAAHGRRTQACGKSIQARGRGLLCAVRRGKAAPLRPRRPGSRVAGRCMRKMLVERECVCFVCVCVCVCAGRVHGDRACVCVCELASRVRFVLSQCRRRVFVRDASSLTRRAVRRPFATCLFLRSRALTILSLSVNDAAF